MELASLSTSTLVICGLIVGFFIYDFATLEGNHRDFRSLIVTTGIFGTFFGIFLGLLEFDAQDIESSVPPLLEGMKTAFLTSVFGLGASGVLTFIALVKGKDGEDEAGATREVVRKVEELIDETKSGFKITNYNLEQALKKLSEGATAQIIQALEGVISDFNNNLKEQFGENFKQLNEAVLRLLDWQENYSVHVENSTEQLNEATSNIKRAIEATVESATAIETIKDSIDKVMSTAKGIDGHASQINAALAAQKKLINELEETLSNFNLNLEKMSSITSNLTDGIQKSLTNQSESLNQLTNSIKDKLPQSLGQLEKTLTGLTQRFGEDYSKFLEATAVLFRSSQK